jgi:hypothetical protein
MAKHALGSKTFFDGVYLIAPEASQLFLANLQSIAEAKAASGEPYTESPNCLRNETPDARRRFSGGWYVLGVRLVVNASQQVTGFPPRIGRDPLPAMRDIRSQNASLHG